MALKDDFADAYKGVGEMLNDERTCHDDCMCNICIAKQQSWEMSEVFVKLQAQLTTEQDENKRLREALALDRSAPDSTAASTASRILPISTENRMSHESQCFISIFILHLLFLRASLPA